LGRGDLHGGRGAEVGGEGGDDVGEGSGLLEGDEATDAGVFVLGVGLGGALNGVAGVRERSSGVVVSDEVRDQRRE